jgi:hypothetical protein
MSRRLHRRYGRAFRSAKKAAGNAKAEWMRTFQDEAVLFGAHPGQLRWADAEYLYSTGWTAKAAARKLYFT